MPRYKVTLKNGNSFTIDADSPSQAKEIVQSRMHGILVASGNLNRDTAAAKKARAKYKEQSTGMDAERIV